MAEMARRNSWPVDLPPQEDGTALAEFPDIPGAVTDGDTEAQALQEAQKCLSAVTGACIKLGRPISAGAKASGRPEVGLGEEDMEHGSGRQFRKPDYLDR